MLPTKNQQDEMARLARLIALTGPRYLRSKQSENYKFLLQKVLKLKDPKVGDIDMSILFIESGLYNVMAGAFKSSIGTSKEVFTSEMHTWINSIVATGSAGWKLIIEGKNKEIRAVNSSSFFSNYENGLEVFTEVTVYHKDKEYYILSRTFRTGVNEVKLYRTTSTTLEGGKQVALDTLPETSELSEIENTGLAIPAFIATKDSDRLFETSQSLVDSVDRKLSALEIEFHKHLQADKIYKNINPPQNAIDLETGIVIKEKMGDTFFSSDDDADILYRFNENPMIDKANENIEKDIRRISAISHIPLEFFGIDSNDGAIGSESRTQKNAIYYAKVEAYRELISEAYKILTTQTLTFGPLIGYDTSTIDGGAGSN